MLRSSAPSRSGGQALDASPIVASSSCVVGGDALRQLLRVRVELAFVEGRERLSGHVGLVEDEEGRAPGGATSGGHAAPPRRDSSDGAASARKDVV